MAEDAKCGLRYMIHGAVHAALLLAVPAQTSVQAIALFKQLDPKVL